MGNILSGAISGLLVGYSVYPLELIRTRLALDVGRNRTERKYKGMLNCILKTYRNNGILEF